VEDEPPARHRQHGTPGTGPSVTLDWETGRSEDCLPQRPRRSS